MSYAREYSLKEAKFILDESAHALKIAENNKFSRSVNGRKILFEKAKEKYEKQNSAFVALKEQAMVNINYSEKKKLIKDAYEKGKIEESLKIANSLHRKLRNEMIKLDK